MPPPRNGADVRFLPNISDWMFRCQSEPLPARRRKFCLEVQSVSATANWLETGTSPRSVNQWAPARSTAPPPTPPYTLGEMSTGANLILFLKTGTNTSTKTETKSKEKPVMPRGTLSHRRALSKEKLWYNKRGIAYNSVGWDC